MDTTSFRLFQIITVRIIIVRTRMVPYTKRTESGELSDCPSQNALQTMRERVEN